MLSFYHSKMTALLAPLENSPLNLPDPDIEINRLQVQVDQGRDRVMEQGVPMEEKAK